MLVKDTYLYLIWNDLFFAEFMLSNEVSPYGMQKYVIQIFSLF